MRELVSTVFISNRVPRKVEDSAPDVRLKKKKDCESPKRRLQAAWGDFFRQNRIESHSIRCSHGLHRLKICPTDS